MPIKNWEPSEEDYIGKKMVPIRMPYELHAYLKDQAHEHRTSLNKHCIDLLRQPLAKDGAES